MVYELVAEVLESYALANEAEPEAPVAVPAVRALAEAGLGQADHSWAHLHPSPHRLPHMVRAEHLQDRLAQSEY